MTQDELRRYAQEKAQEYGVDPALVMAMFTQESNWNPHAVSKRGAYGIAQLMPATAKSLGVDARDPLQNIEGGVRLIRQLQDKYQSPELIAAAYNAGEGAVAKHGGIPPYKETQDYVRKVTKNSIDPARVVVDQEAIDPSKVKIDPAQVVVDQPQLAVDPKMAQSAALVRQMMPPQLGGQWAPDLAMGLRSGIDAGAQLLTRGIEAVAPKGSAFEQWAKGQRQNVEATNTAAQQDYQQRFNPQGTPGSSIAQGVGSALLPGALLGKLPMAASLLGRAAQSAGIGGATAALEPVPEGQPFAQRKAEQVGAGALLGGLLGPAMEIGGRVLSPKTAPAVQQMVGEKVYPTLGETLGRRGAVAEEKATSLPFVGEMIRDAQRRSIEQFNRAVYRRTLAPLGPEAVKVAETAPVGRDGIAKVGDTLSDAYDQVLARSQTNKIDSAFVPALKRLGGMIEKTDTFNKIIKNEVTDKFVGPKIPTTAAWLSVGRRPVEEKFLPPSAAKEVESELGRLARQYKGSDDPANRELSRALTQAQAELRNLVARNNPAIAPRIKDINRGWANLVQLENAGSMLGAKEGVFTPSQYMNAIKRGDKSLRDRRFARNEALNQEFGTAAEQVLARKYPDSGTAGRWQQFRPLPLTLGLAGAGLMGPLYSSMGQRLAAGALTKRPDWLRAVGTPIRDYSPYLTAPLTAGLLGQ